MTSTCERTAGAAEAACWPTVSAAPSNQTTVSTLRMSRPPEGECVDPGAFCGQARLLIVAGKGGVGKTTVSAALARMAALAGLTTLVIEVEGKSGLATAFGHRDSLSYREVVMVAGGGPDGAADVRARTLTPDDALLEYLEDHGMRRVSKRLASSGGVGFGGATAPGNKDN